MQPYTAALGLNGLVTVTEKSQLDRDCCFLSSFALLPEDHITQFY